VVGLAAAAFSEAVKEIACVFDPSLDVRLEFKSGTEGTVVLNAVLRLRKTRDGQRGTPLGIVIGTSIAFIGDIRLRGSTRLLDYYFPKEERVQLATPILNALLQLVGALQRVRLRANRSGGSTNNSNAMML
jgi:hypothetical protein